MPNLQRSLKDSGLFMLLLWCKCNQLMLIVSIIVKLSSWNNIFYTFIKIFEWVFSSFNQYHGEPARFRWPSGLERRSMSVLKCASSLRLNRFVTYGEPALTYLPSGCWTHFLWRQDLASWRFQPPSLYDLMTWLTSVAAQWIWTLSQPTCAINKDEIN